MHRMSFNPYFPNSVFFIPTQLSNLNLLIHRRYSSGIISLFSHPTTNTLHQLLLAWRPDKEDYAQMPTFLISIRTLFRTLPEFFKNFAPQSIMDAIRSLLSPALQHAIDVQRGSVITNDDILPCLIRIQHQHPSSP